MDHPDANRQPELKSLEARLRRWQPAASAIDRDRLLFESGRFAGSRGPRPGVLVGIMSVMLVGLATAWWSEHDRLKSAERELASHKVSAPSSRPHELDDPPAPLRLVQADRTSYLALRQLLDEGGSVDVTEPSDNPRKPKDQPDRRESDRPLRAGTSEGVIDL